MTLEELMQATISAFYQNPERAKCEVFLGATHHGYNGTVLNTFGFDADAEGFVLSFKPHYP